MSLETQRVGDPLPKFTPLDGVDYLITITAMDIDQTRQPNSTTDSSSRTGSAGQIQKRGRSKARPAMGFPVYRKGKRVGARLNVREIKKSLRP